MTQEPLISILDSLESGELEIPPHQREYVWKRSQEPRLVKTVQQGTPMPPVILRSEGRGSDIKKSLEDGRQRLTCLTRFRKDQFAVDGKKYSELSPIEQFQFNNYPMPVLTYKNATLSQAIDIFDNFQNGTPLSSGERYHSLLQISPIIKLAYELLLTPGTGFHDRAAEVWGKHDGIGKRGIDLVSAVALVAHLAFSGGENCYLSKKYSEMIPVIRNPLTRSTEERVRGFLETILSIYEEAQARVPLEYDGEFKFQWDLGHFTGYIAYSLVKFPTETDRLKTGWVNYLCEVRTKRSNFRSARGAGKLKAALVEKLHRDISQARNWTSTRWWYGYLRVFDPEEAKRVIDDVSATSTESSDEEDDE